MTQRIHTIEVPPRYWDDHRRACTSQDDPIVEEGSRGKVRVTLSERDLDELRSRAHYTAYYQEFYGEDPAFWLGLKASARATVKAVDRYRAATAVPKSYSERVAELEAEGCTTSDAQSIADVEVSKGKVQGDASHAFLAVTR